jgi:hypothetical protein
VTSTGEPGPRRAGLDGGSIDRADHHYRTPRPRGGAGRNRRDAAATAAVVVVPPILPPTGNLDLEQHPNGRPRRLPGGGALGSLGQA